MKRMKCVKVEKKGGISWVWLNRPEKRNAMSPQLHSEMDETLRELETDPDFFDHFVEGGCLGSRVGYVDGESEPGGVVEGGLDRTVLV